MITSFILPSILLSAQLHNGCPVPASNSSLTIQERLSRFETVELTGNLSRFTTGDLQAVNKLIKVAHLLDRVYVRQVAPGNEELYNKLVECSAAQPDLLQLYKLFRGPWDLVDEEQPYIEGVKPRPDTANFYPVDMSKYEFEAWLETLSQKERQEAKGFYHVIRRGENQTLEAVPYSLEYQDLLEPAAKLLQESATLVSDASLSRFLNSRGSSLLSNEYLESELDWINVSDKSPLEITVGPYETYDDKMNSYKASFEIFIHARDFESTALLKVFEESLPMVEKDLPVGDRYKNKHLRSTPIVVVNELYNGGDATVPMTAAYNLPNDEQAIKRGGSKLVIIKNVQESKFKSILVKIADTLLDPEQIRYVDFEAFFNHILLHEVSHSNGPHETVQEPRVPIRSRLQEYHSTLEEAKADITGLFAAKLLFDQGSFKNTSMENFYVTYLASAFRSIRFGLNEAHGRGQAAQLNYLIDHGGFVYDPKSQRFRVDFAKIEEAVKSLVRDIMVIQGDGDKRNAENFLNTYGINRDYTQLALEKIAKIPIDIQPQFTITGCLGHLQ
ncbi:hypothetical protein K493DRAFT_277737 [Basidiobolus meristosporus CBS 931.73]|uniref:MutT/nudix family protein n=1 Tax=Basidiobolus meristosporus CBS 931.73 TaxID=1314790 RepID=A0A1Y1YV29_9FUNG|nr:hypothetical protein K493DRAFT_277737 [Basidiobolus meristosporus CBS 931.73]|eukprot:ORY01694.1 hypothetical protein K493DRAFT_277737 [Basidiobolus meristosporus CBS 931.73]